MAVVIMEVEVDMVTHLQPNTIAKVFNHLELLE
jgi:hypothetical protein